MGEFSRQLDAAARIIARAEGGVITGDIPTHFNAANPFRLWVIQLVIIIAFTQLLALPLSRLRQPRVIAEVISGVILGPTVMGRIPGFLDTIFPEPSMPLLNLTATIGLILFLFLVGLEIDTRLLKRNVKASFTVSLAGLIIPLGLGAALGVGLYREFMNDSVNMGHFLLFCAVAIGITAFPVLCRILSELKLIDTQVGVIVLSAGIGNDVIGWVLLALTVALVNASAGLSALYILLATLGYTIFLLYPVRLGFVWLARRTGSLEQGSPTTFMMTVTLLIVFISAFFTDIIGVHAIFGGFLAGLIIPHENGFAISLVEKIEDLVSILLLPIYFTLSGLKTNLGLLDNGITWGYTILICVVAFASKFLACAGAALAFGFDWREAGAIGSLMSCKGLVELIVLNIGLQAGVLDPRTFSMFVVHALVLTFITTPLTLLFYPAKYRVSMSKEKDGGETESKHVPHKPADAEMKTRFAMVLEKVEQLPAAMTLCQLLQCNEAAVNPKAIAPAPSDTQPGEPEVKVKESSSSLSTQDNALQSNISIDALRLLELTHRTSAVLKSQEAEALLYNDPVITVFRSFGYLNNLAVSAHLSIVNHDEFTNAVSQHVLDSESEMVIIPWSRGTTSVLLETDTQSHSQQARNPFDGVFHRTTTQDQTSSVVYSEFIRSVFLRCSTDVALFVDRGVTSGQVSGAQHLFLPFFGGPDDRLALSFLVQLCARSFVSATVIRISKAEEESSAGADIKERPMSPLSPMSPPPQHPHITVAAADTVYGAHTTQTRLASDTADNLLWERYTNPTNTHSATITSAISRITFSSQDSATPLRTVTELVKGEVEKAATVLGRTVIVLAGRSRRMAVEPLGRELRQFITETGSHIGSSVPKTLGDVGAALVITKTDASLLILQASATSSTS
ncbi:cation/H+ exchanger [Coprinopsis marcescibilis]|uniref:Cation/H+ exchanger n=1 Tax=Coprinopsis marcescibilis TaxID=230819 RepID=A0A5C3L8P5_COPMA|nr:cation/H+ exchanger [Coprinopsis marcescibilis]